MDLGPTQLAFLKEKASPRKHWLQQSIAINGGNGSSAFYSRLHHPLRGWSPAYPETTGYLIPTLLQYHRLFPDEDLLTQAILCGEWLLSIQHPDGWFPALYQNSGKPSLFNTAMILFGFVALFKNDEDERYKKSIQRALEWYRKAATSNNGTELHQQSKRSFYTRAIWALLEGDEIVKIPGFKDYCQDVLISFQREIESNGWIRNWEFEGQDFVFTHTMAYTWRGFLESGFILKDKDLFESALQSFDLYLKRVSSEPHLSGAYDKNWKGDESFICLPGTFQLSILAFRAFEISGNEAYKNWGVYFWENGNSALPETPWGKAGGIFGSNPVSGKYMPWKQPNWGTKFYLDALWLYTKHNGASH